MKNPFKKSKEKKHGKKCDCFICRNPDLADTLKKIIKKINKEDQETKVLTTKGIVQVLVDHVELTLIDRMGILNVVENEIWEKYKGMLIMATMKEVEDDKREVYTV